MNTREYIGRKFHLEEMNATTSKCRFIIIPIRGPMISHFHWEQDFLKYSWEFQVKQHRKQSNQCIVQILHADAPTRPLEADATKLANATPVFLLHGQDACQDTQEGG